MRAATVLREAAHWWCFLLVAILLLFPILGPGFIGALKLLLWPLQQLDQAMMWLKG